LESVHRISGQAARRTIIIAAIWPKTIGSFDGGSLAHSHFDRGKCGLVKAMHKQIPNSGTQMLTQVGDFGD
jgi:hypothetical protein